MRLLRAATRGSALARRQTDGVAALLQRSGFAVAGGVVVESVIVQTTGDRRTDVPLWQMGGRGVFVKEVQAAVLDGRADFAVHSAKDLPSAPTEGLVIAAVPPREDPRDALVGRTLDGLESGALIGTGSVRRRAQLAWWRPDLTFGLLRGNIETRLDKATAFAAIVVAAAALVRLDRRAAASQVLPPELMVPQAGQGALAIECRADDAETAGMLAAIDDAPSHLALDAERSFLQVVAGTCDLPVGALAVVREGHVDLLAMVASLDGRVVLRHRAEGADATTVGRDAAEFLLDGAGGRNLLELLPPVTGVVGAE